MAEALGLSQRFYDVRPLTAQERGQITMRGENKYGQRFYLPPEDRMEWAAKTRVETAPYWCALDIGEAGMALPGRLSGEEKEELCRVLIQAGVREIDCGMPAAGGDDFAFCRRLIEKKLLPEGALLRLTAKASEESIRKTLEAAAGAEAVRIGIRVRMRDRDGGEQVQGAPESDVYGGEKQIGRACAPKSDVYGGEEQTGRIGAPESYVCGGEEQTGRACAPKCDVYGGEEQTGRACAPESDVYDGAKQTRRACAPESDAYGGKEQTGRACAPESDVYDRKVVCAAELLGRPAGGEKGEGNGTGFPERIFPGNVFPELIIEDFSEAKPREVLELISRVLSVWKPDSLRRAAVSLGSECECAPAHVFASQVEYIHRNMPFRDAVILSVRPANDRGGALSDAELALLAGAQRVEGTLFGNGSGSGCAALVPLALNLLAQGTDPGLDVSDIPGLRDACGKASGITAEESLPYVGALAFSGFSDGQWEAARRGMAAYRRNGGRWQVPYLYVDPEDIGREGDFGPLRPETQGGRSSVSQILRTHYSLSIPELMQGDVGATIREAFENSGKKMTPEGIYRVFDDYYINALPYFQVGACHFRQENGIVADVVIRMQETEQIVTGTGNGRLDAVSNAIKSCFDISYELSVYEEHSLTRGSSSKAVAFVGLLCGGRRTWGAGIDTDIIHASIEALAVAVNKLESFRDSGYARDGRMVEIMNYIQTNYLEISLDSLSERFYLSKPYLSKYIRQKSGKTFGELVKNIRLKKARAMLRSTSMTVESIAAAVGYQNVEHFNRLFRKSYRMTPLQYRNMR